MDVDAKTVALTKKVCMALDREAAKVWPEADLELTCAYDRGRVLYSLRVANLILPPGRREHEGAFMRRVAGWFARGVKEGTGLPVSLVSCPRPKVFTDHRAPRISHYEGSTWVYEST